MRKPLWSLLMIVFTALFTLVMLGWKQEETPVEARIVTVQRSDVHQVVALTGRIAYADERYVYASGSGMVTQLCVEDGQRVGAGEALVRLENDAQEDVLSAFIAHSDMTEDLNINEEIEAQLLSESSVIRADEACTVRQLLIAEESMITAGMPVARISSHQQEIICSVAPVDAEKIDPGMWAWISSEDSALGFAEVQAVGKLEVDPLTGWSYCAVVLHPDKHIDMAEGAAVDVDVYLAGSDDVLSLPVEAITERNTVWWVNEGRCTEIPAEFVMADEMRAWVNLPEGITVAVGEFQEGQRIVEADE